MATNPKNNSHIPRSQVEVFEVPGEPCVLGFKLASTPMFTVEGRFNVALAFEGIALEAQALLSNVIDGRSLGGTPFSKAGITINPRWYGSNKATELSEMMSECVAEAAKQEILLVFDRLGSLGERAVSDGIILTSLRMDENQVIETIKGGKAEILKAYGREVGKTARTEMSQQTSARTRTWTKVRRRTALALYDSTYKRIKDLKKICRDLGLDGKGRQRADWKRWGQVRAKNADLANVLDLLPDGNLLELTLSYVCDQLGTRAHSNVYREIKRARRERRELQEHAGIASIEAAVSRAVDSVLRKRESNCSSL